jgi:hypothetical protein
LIKETVVDVEKEGWKAVGKIVEEARGYVTHEFLESGRHVMVMMFLVVGMS